MELFHLEHLRTGLLAMPMAIYFELTVMYQNRTRVLEGGIVFLVLL